MISNPLEQLEWYIDAGADLITIHVESNQAGLVPHSSHGASASVWANDLHELAAHMRMIQTIRDAGRLAGISLNPGTPASIIGPYVDKVDLILVMSVHPGFGGQSYIAESTDKIAAIAAAAATAGASPIIEVDGGINAQSAPLASAAGASMLVAGNAIFAAADPVAALHELRGSAAEAKR
jgi:ribulose-phosphate 3-epimerase